jgi:hypothetical protein
VLAAILLGAWLNYIMRISINCLLRPPLGPSLPLVTPQQLQVTRQKYQQAMRRWQELSKELEAHLKSVAEGEDALQEAERLGHSKLRLVKEELRCRKSRLRRCRAVWRKAQGRELDLKRNLQQQEAAFARIEVIRFVKSKRYKLSLHNVANAIAGLPYMGWRQSFARCSRLEGKTIPPASFYEVFKVLEKAFRDGRPGTTVEALRLFEDEVRRNRKIPEPVRKFLKDYESHLREAVSQCLRNKTIRSTQFPYNLAAAFRRRVLRPRTALERLLKSGDLTSR